MRENTKKILWVVVIAFVISIFAIWGMNLKGPSTKNRDRSILGSVDGVNITRQTYINTLNQLYAQLRESRGEDYEPTSSERKLLQEQAWETVIRDILISKEIEKLKISITDDELISFLKTNPHPSLRKVFKKENGDFDYQAYIKALSDPSIDWTELENWGRSLLPQLKLQIYLAAEVHIPEREIIERYNELYTEMKAKYIKVPFKEEEPPYEPSDNEIQLKYNELADELKEPEKRKISIIKIEKKPSEYDEKEALDRSLEIRKEILDGRDFADAAKEYSDDPVTAPKGGDLGFFKKGDMVAEFDSAAFSLKIGEISQPVRTRYGYHLIKVDEKKFEDSTEKVHARHILIKVEPGYETIDSLSTLLRDIVSSIRKEGFEKTAENMHLNLITPEPFTESPFIKEIGYIPQITDFAFKYKPGKISAPIETEDAIYIVKVLEVLPAKQLPLEDVKQTLVEKIRRERMKKKAEAIAKQIRDKLLGGESFESVAKEFGLEAKETPPFTMEGNIPEIGANTGFARACYLLKLNEISPPIMDSNNYYIIKVVEKKKPDMENYESKKNEILTQLQKEKASHFLAGWYDQIRKSAKVEDLRDRTLN